MRIKSQDPDHPERRGENSIHYRASYIAALAFGSSEPEPENQDPCHCNNHREEEPLIS